MSCSRERLMPQSGFCLKPSKCIRVLLAAPGDTVARHPGRHAPGRDTTAQAATVPAAVPPRLRDGAAFPGEDEARTRISRPSGAPFFQEMH
ncbi:hypothetical protein mvi_12730 [Methylobacterium indicum]|uniref:Uncharacterized protein n=1 Tax=Methylobacterium indicum TaxID=1775910 RepID=A0A8H8WR57_9HYPH|nr:hypothetical protein mvi_12730 [Methylobacterium indicum]